MAEMLINNWGGGIGDDPFLSRPGECLDMDGIDIRTTPRRITADQTSSGIYATNTLATAGETLNYVTETIDGIVQSYGTNCYINSTGINPLVAGATYHVTTGSNLSDYNISTNPEGVKHIFFQNANIRNVVYSGGVRALKSSIATNAKIVFTVTGATTTTIGSTYTNNGQTFTPVYEILVGGAGFVICTYTGLPSTGTLTRASGTGPASVAFSRWEYQVVQKSTTYAYKVARGMVLFSRDNLIYEYNPETETFPEFALKIELPGGSIVKCINQYNGLIYVLYTDNKSTYVKSYTWNNLFGNSSVFAETSYTDISTGYVALSAVADGGKIYWVSISGVHIYSGQSQLVKMYTLSTSALVKYNKSVLRIADGVNFYEYGNQKPGYGSPFTKKTIVGGGLSIVGLTENYIITFLTTGTQYKIDQFGVGYKATNTFITHPYTAGQFGIDKKGLGIRIGYFLPRDTYIDPAIQCSITVAIQTKDMELTSSWATIATITDNAKTNRTIMLQEIASTLGSASFSEEFPLFKIKLTLNAGDAYSGTGNTIFRKTPEVYDIYLTHEEIKQSI